MSEFLRCRDCKHDKGKCVGLSRWGSHKNCFEPREMTNADRIRAMTDCANKGRFCYAECEKYHCKNFKWRGPQKEE